jgi:hypothetical protein
MTTPTPRTLEELVQLLQDGDEYYLHSEDLERLGLSTIIKHRLESWSMSRAEFGHDPVDMIKVEPPSEAETALAQITEQINWAIQSLVEASQGRTRSEASWLIDSHVQRAQAEAQIAQAQASYAIALQLRRLTDLLEESLPEISKHIDDIPEALEYVGNRIPS